jgi:hypothetical protein
MGGGIVLILVGAILEFAVSVNTEQHGFNIHTVGLIFLAVGIAAFVAGLIVVLTGGRHRSTMREDVHTTPHGRERTQEQEDWAS